MNTLDISICVITYKRPAWLKNLLESLALQSLSLTRFEIIVVDNDFHASSKTVVDDFKKKHSNVLVTYDVETEQGIPLARNKSVELARGNYVAFIDDDEVADSHWLEELFGALVQYDADAVLGPVIPVYPEKIAQWIVRGKFFERPRFKDGMIVAVGRTSNACVSKLWLDKYEYPFDPALRLTGGSDSKFFDVIQRAGARLCWADKAVVYENLEKERLDLKWLLKRAFRGGQNFGVSYCARENFFFCTINVIFRFLLSIFSACMSLVVICFGFHHSVWWLRKAFSNLGQCLSVSNYRYEEYNEKRYRSGQR